MAAVPTPIFSTCVELVVESQSGQHVDFVLDCVWNAKSHQYCMLVVHPIKCSERFLSMHTHDGASFASHPDPVPPTGHAAFII